MKTKEIEFFLTPNGSEIKLQWRADGYGSSFSKPIRISADLLRRRSADVRDALTAMNEYVRRNPHVSEERDQGWATYRSRLADIVDAGRALRAALLRSEPGAKPLEDALADIGPGAVMKISCSDEEVTFPFGFIYEDGEDLGEAAASQPGLAMTYRPSHADFARFWVSRYRISMLVEGSGCATDDLTINPDTLRALYALHKAELEASVPDLGSDCDTLKQLLKLKVGDHYDWNSAQRAWRSIDTSNSIVFVLAHSDGDYLKLQDSKLESLQFRDMLEKRNAAGATLLILNCCLSATGAVGASLLSAVARRGFCGLVGTEAEILNSAALRFGTLLLKRLLKNGEPLGQAFDAVQQDASLFPLNLFYTCYADRAFRLREPMRFDA